MDEERRRKVEEVQTSAKYNNIYEILIIKFICILAKNGIYVTFKFSFESSHSTVLNINFKAISIHYPFITAFSFLASLLWLIWQSNIVCHHPCLYFQGWSLASECWFVIIFFKYKLTINEFFVLCSFQNFKDISLLCLKLHVMTENT